MQRLSNLTTMCLTLTGLMFLATSVRGEERAAPKKLALLVGCSEYQQSQMCSTLTGPLNDIPLLARVLVDRFGYREADIVRLVGWPDDVARRPSYQNIVAGFETLIHEAQPGTQVMILMSGHGTQVPIPDSQTDPLDPRNPEPDGLDEVFLAADAQAWSKAGLVNAIRDDQIGAWLDQLKAKGAAVWILFDCCHSGTISRGAVQPAETARGTTPESAGVPAKQLQAAMDRAAAAVRKSPRRKDEEAAVQVNQESSKTGSVTAFFAAQPYEEAPELFRPEGAPHEPQNKFGLMSYVLAQTLLNHQGKRPLTYRELSQLVIAQYRSERGSRGPTPMFEGQMDREVLGLKAWPAQSGLRLERFEKELKIPGGALRGLTVGTVLRVLPLGAESGGPHGLGHVRVASVTPAAAVVEPCEFQGVSAPQVEALPMLAPCVVVSQDLGEMRVPFRLQPSPRDDLRGLNGRLKSVVEKLAANENTFLKIASADVGHGWTLRVITPLEAATEFKLKLAEPAIALLKPSSLASAKTASHTAGTPAPDQTLQLVRTYKTSDAATLAAMLEQDVQKIYTWQNVWRAAHAVNSGRKADPDIIFEVMAAPKGEAAKAEPLRQTTLRPGQSLEVRIKNNSIEEQWVTLLFLGGDLSITVVTSAGLPDDKELARIRCTINDSSLGTEGFLLLAVPISKHKLQPDYQFLVQGPVGSGEGPAAAHRGVGKQAPVTPFGQLMARAVLGKGTRGAEPEAPDNPEIHSWSWVTMPAVKP